MADDFLEQVFSDKPVDPVVEAPAPEPETTMEPAPETVKEPTPAPEVTPQVERQDHSVPLPKYLDTRDELKEAKRKLAEYESRSQQQPEIPDPFDQPEAYQAYMGQQLQSALQAQKVDMSWAFSVQQHGEEKTQAAKDWALDKAQKDPGFRAMLDTEFSTQAMPVNWLVAQHQREEAMGKLGGRTLDDWFNEELARRNLTPSAPVAAAPVPPVAAIPASRPAMPPRSIAADATPAAAAPSDNPMAGLDAIFNRR